VEVEGACPSLPFNNGATYCATGVGHTHTFIVVSGKKTVHIPMRRRILGNMNGGKDGRRLRVSGRSQQGLAIQATKLACLMILIIASIAVFVNNVPLKSIAPISVVLLGCILGLGYVAWKDGKKKIDRGKTEEWIDNGEVADDPPV